MREFSDEARQWLSSYHGPIDATALLLAFDAGRLYTRAEIDQQRREAIDEALQAVSDVLPKEAWILLGRARQNLSRLEVEREEQDLCLTLDRRRSRECVGAQTNEAPHRRGANVGLSGSAGGCSPRNACRSLI